MDFSSCTAIFSRAWLRSGKAADRQAGNGLGWQGSGGPGGRRRAVRCGLPRGAGSGRSSPPARSPVPIRRHTGNVRGHTKKTAVRSAVAPAWDRETRSPSSAGRRGVAHARDAAGTGRPRPIEPLVTATRRSRDPPPKTAWPCVPKRNHSTAVPREGILFPVRRISRKARSRHRQAGPPLRLGSAGRTSRAAAADRRRKTWSRGLSDPSLGSACSAESISLSTRRSRR